MEPTSDCLINIAQDGLVIARYHQFELRRKFEIVLAHEPGLHAVSASKPLNLGLVPGPAFICLHSCNKSRALHSGNIGGVPVKWTGGEGFDRGDCGIVANDAPDGFNENRLSVCPGPIKEE